MADPGWTGRSTRAATVLHVGGAAPYDVVVGHGVLDRIGDALPAGATRVALCPAPGIEDLASDLGDVLDTRVLVDMGRKKGRIVIEFATTDDLSRISDLIRGRRTTTAGSDRRRAVNE